MNEGFNRVVLFGNLGADPELRRLQNGSIVLKMRLATNHSFLNRDGVREEKTEWHYVSVWGPRAEGLSRILHKGSFLLVEGHLQTSSYEKDGQRRYSTEINAQRVVLGGRCGPAGHEGEGAPDAVDRAGDAETLRDDAATPPDAGFEARGAQEPGGAQEPEVFEPILPQRPPRGDNGAGGAAAPPPPSPRKRARSGASQTTLAAA